MSHNSASEGHYRPHTRSHPHNLHSHSQQQRSHHHHNSHQSHHNNSHHQSHSSSHLHSSQQSQQQSSSSSSSTSARLTIGDVVLISDPSEGIGVVRHIDEINFIIGIELTDPLGTSNGVYNGMEYFKCRPKYGIFVSVTDIVRLVSPEELLHKIVVLNRALAHKHSTLTSKNQSIDKLKKEIITLKQTLSTYHMNQQNLQNEIQELKHELQQQINMNQSHLLDPPTNNNIHNNHHDINDHPINSVVDHFTNNHQLPHGLLHQIRFV